MCFYFPIIIPEFEYDHKWPDACLALMSSAIASPIFDGLFTTLIPLDSRHAILDLASPFPPEIMAPAWPILLPGGAV